MNNSFPRIITLLRTERKLTQKQAAASLEISQALLSHYERGIRECGLDFLVRAADFYGVSCDYLLGRTPDRNGAQLTVEDIPNPDEKIKDNRFRGSALPTLNKKLIANSLNILYDMLQKADCKALTSEASAYLMIAVYKMFRLVYLASPGNSKSFFSVSEPLARGISTASMEVLESYVECVASGKDIDELEGVRNTEALNLSEEALAANYPLFASSLLNLIRCAENRMLHK